MTPWTIACQTPLSMEFSRQEYGSGLPLPSPGDLSDSGFKPVSLASPALVGGFFTTSATWEAPFHTVSYKHLHLVKNLNTHTHTHTHTHIYKERERVILAILCECVLCSRYIPECSVCWLIFITHFRGRNYYYLFYR